MWHAVLIKEKTRVRNWYEKKICRVFLTYVLVNDVISSFFRFLIKKVEKDQMKAQKIDKGPERAKILESSNKEKKDQL